MKISADRVGYVCPNSLDPLQFVEEDGATEPGVHGALVSPSGSRYPVADGVADLTYPDSLLGADRVARLEYDAAADSYDDNMWFIFETFGVDEKQVRSALVDELRLTPTSRVLEFGAGSGRDSERICDRLGEDTLFCVQEISRPFLMRAVNRLEGRRTPMAFSVGNGSYLPFPNDYFDATFHFGGLNTFAEPARALSEAVRVTRSGGRVVVGDEGVGPWLRETEYGRILTTANKMYAFDAPLSAIPCEARRVEVKWILGEAFYVMCFDVGEGPPVANFDIAIPGRRGGTFNARYHGQLEGVSKKARRAVDAAANRAGKPRAQWLEDAILHAAKSELGELPE